MEDWKFKITFTDKLSSSDVLGEVDFYSDKKAGIIRILSSKAAKRQRLPESEYDQEHILVHELLHCRFTRVHLPNSPSYEEAIDCTAACIINLRRQLQN